MKRKPKQYPMDGPPLDVQAARLKPNRTVQEQNRIHSWVKHFAKKDGRPETVEAYSV